MSDRIAYVYVKDIYSGVLKETDNGYSFKYDKDYLNSPLKEAVSLTLPIREEEYNSSILFPFFDGLIPEGYTLDVIKKTWKINEKDRFSLLFVSCSNSIGKVSISEVQR